MSGNEAILWTVVIAIVTGIVAQFIAAFIGIPSIVPLLFLGIIIGPEVLDFLDPKALGTGFEAIIKLSVAIILFEAGLNLDRAEIKKHQRVIFRLITYGGLITMVLAAFLSKFIMDLSWFLAFLFGSLVIVTGPTVIHPLLRRVKVGARLKNILESEGVFIDPIGAIIAIFVFELILEKSPSFFHPLSLGFARLGIGIVIGVIGGFLIGKAVKRWSIIMEEIGELFVLASALGIYALSEATIPESGLMAAVASGAIIGNMDIPEEDTLRKFKGRVSILVISLLFILLAANLKLEYITSLGWNGIFVVLALLFIVRPVEILLTTFGSGLNLNEKAFLSFISPRGIVAASVSSIFAIQLHDRGFQGGDVVQGLVFLTIGISVVLQGITANSVARALGVLIKARKTVIVGANSFGRLVGKLLKMYGKEVSFIDTNENLVRVAYTEGFEAIEGNGLDTDKLEEAGITEADTTLAVTTSNKVNLLLCRLAKEDFKIKDALPVLNQTEGGIDKEMVSKLGLEIAFGKPLNVYEINSKISHREFKVFECSVDDSIAGKRIEELYVPNEVTSILIIRGKSRIPILSRSNMLVEKGDKIAIVDFSDGLKGLLEGAGFRDYTQINL